MVKKTFLIGLILAFVSFVYASDVTGDAVSSVTTDVTTDATGDVVVQASDDMVEKVDTSNEEIKVIDGTVYNNGYIDFVSPKVVFVIEASDDLSGVKSVYYSVDGSLYDVYGNALSVNDEGRHFIDYKVEDKVGNISSIKKYDFILDKTAPTLKIATDAVVIVKGTTKYLSKDAKIFISAYDALSGVKSINFNVDNSSDSVYSESFVLSANKGLHSVVASAVDNVGNSSDFCDVSYFVDADAPVVTITPEQEPVDVDGVKVIAAKTAIKIEAADADTGVKALYYAIDEGEFAPCTGDIKLTAGKHTVKAKAIDLVGNVSEVVVYEVTVDAVNPSSELLLTKN